MNRVNSIVFDVNLTLSSRVSKFGTILALYATVNSVKYRLSVFSHRRIIKTVVVVHRIYVAGIRDTVYTMLCIVAQSLCLSRNKTYTTPCSRIQLELHKETLMPVCFCRHFIAYTK